MLVGSPKPSPDDQLLHRIAVALGISDEAFSGQPAQLMFHTELSGDRWFLASGALGKPTVCCLSIHSRNPTSTGVSVATFLAENLDQPQGRALAGLIDRVLSMHLYPDMRS
jgi:hypothetical protein